jgi:hypothetical protein
MHTVVCNAMTTFKRLTFTFFISLVILLVIHRIFVGEVFNAIFTLGFWIAALIFSLVGQLAGFLAYQLINRPDKKNRVYFNTAVITCIFLGLIFSVIRFSEWRQKTYFGNIASNRNFIVNTENYRHETLIAFDTLERKFKSPNDFKVIGKFIYPMLLTSNGHKDTNFLIRFLYYKNGSSLEMKAELSMVKNVATLIEFDVPLTKGNKSEIDSFLVKGKKQILRSIRLIPDSLKIEELDEIAEELKR